MNFLNPALFMFTAKRLFGILNNYITNCDFRFKKLPIDAIKTIRSLRLNRKRRRHKYTCQKRKAQHEHEQKHGSRPNNLTKVKIENQREHTNIIIGTINIQSIKNKELKTIDL